MLPKYLYKYRDWDDQNHKKLLTQNEIYFTSAKQFNDPFDSTILLRYDLLEDAHFLELYKKHIKMQNPQLKDEAIEDLAKKEMSKGLYKDPNHLKRHYDYVQEKRYKDFGIFSCSEIHNSILMWSLYSNSHEGFCVGFNAEKMKTFFEKISVSLGVVIEHHEVEYVKDYPILNPSEMTIEQIVLKALIIKAANWEYEKEHRFILMKHPSFHLKERNIRIQSGIICKVILGCNMPALQRREIIGLLREQPDKIELLQARIKKGSFGLDFESIDY